MLIELPVVAQDGDPPSVRAHVELLPKVEELNVFDLGNPITGLVEDSHGIQPLVTARGLSVDRHRDVRIPDEGGVDVDGSLPHYFV